MRLGIVATRWHRLITDQLVERALAAAKAAGTDEPTVVRVAGAIDGLRAHCDHVRVLGSYPAG